MVGTWPDVGCSDVSGSMCFVTSPVDPSSCLGVGSSDLLGVCKRFNFSDSSIAFLKSWEYRFCSCSELRFSFPAVFLAGSSGGDECDTEISGDNSVCPLFARFGFGILCEECDTEVSRDEDADDAEASYAEDEESGGYDMSYFSSS